ncbi:COG1361 family protein [Halorubrum amylolyticum]|uniref:hypothetical protein n=1 Tax=Halorubrum amylolyticum TaxID=2508724 RepID=UPI001008FD57|nr:hypothetical protein [Halorubrum amylolyticum]
MSRRRSIAVAAVLALLIGGAGVTLGTVAADTPPVQVSNVTATPSDPITDETVTVETTVSNLQSSDDAAEITDIYLRTAGSSETHARAEDVGSVAPGGSVSVSLRTSFETTGEKELRVFLRIEDESGSSYTVEHPVYVDVTAPDVRGALSVETTNTSDRTTVELTNYGNTDFEDVAITASANGETFDRNYLFDVAPDATGSTSFDTADVSEESVTVNATYRAAGRSRTLSETVDLGDEQVQGEIRLTGLEPTRSGTGVTISGEAANVGSTDTESVLLSVRDTDDADPVAPSGEYFIGAVEASEFATFELTADIGEDADSVPIELSYIVDDERVTTTQRVSIPAQNASEVGTGAPAAAGDGGQAPDRGGSPGLPLTEVGAVLGMALVGGGSFAVYRWRNQ